jgi:anti-sigma B factor antagonist
MCAERNGGPTRDETASFGTTTQARGGGVLLEVAGEIDMATAPRLGAAIDAALGDRPDLLVIDLTKVEFLGSAGLSVLMTGQQAAAAQSTQLRVVAAGSVTARPIQITGLDELLPLFLTADEAFGQT